jgi:hypothetical protein
MDEYLRITLADIDAWLTQRKLKLHLTTRGQYVLATVHDEKGRVQATGMGRDLCRAVMLCQDAYER